MRDRDSAREYERKWYSTPEGHAKRVAINKRRRDKLRQWLDEYKSKLFCQVCGENHIATLDFHHRNPNEKDANIAQLLNAGSHKRLLDEIAKCDVLCANCHRKHHWNEKQV